MPDSRIEVFRVIHPGGGARYGVKIDGKPVTLPMVVGWHWDATAGFHAAEPRYLTPWGARRAGRRIIESFG